jgi:hypothetical protein
MSAFAYDLSADSLLMENGERQKGTIDIKGDKYRIQRDGESEYIILRHDKNVMWVVVPGEKVYVELPLDPRRTPKIEEKNPGEISRKLIGTEVVDGHPANKFRITVREGPKTETFYQWTATDLDFPIKTAAEDGEWSVEFTNIKKGVSDRVFDIPKGYQKARIVIKPEQEETGTEQES